MLLCTLLLTNNFECRYYCSYGFNWIKYFMKNARSVDSIVVFCENLWHGNNSKFDRTLIVYSTFYTHFEPPRLLRSDGKRPDGATLDPWTGGRYLVWDFTCPDTLAPSHLFTSSAGAGGEAQAAESRKSTKYQELVASGNFLFSPVAIETLGTWGPSAIALCQDLGGRIAQVTGDPRSLAFLKQRLSLAVQRGNVSSVLGTLPQSMEPQNLI